VLVSFAGVNRIGLRAARARACLFHGAAILDAHFSAASTNLGWPEAGLLNLSAVFTRLGVTQCQINVKQMRYNLGATPRIELL